MAMLAVGAFFDYDSIKGGYFDSRIYDAIEKCENVVLILPPSALDRCENEDDWLRLEIRHALKHGKPIVPVMLPGFVFPRTLPSDIEEISRYNGVQFVITYFDAVIDAIVDRFLQYDGWAELRRKPHVMSMLGLKSPVSEGLEFEADGSGDGLAVRIGTCTADEIIIPRVYNEKTVTAIAVEAFSGCTSIKSITIPDSVTKIYRYAFMYCSSLKEINYKGTVDMWNEIYIMDELFREVPAEVVHCSDGDVPL